MKQVPIATYRLQFYQNNQNFTFENVSQIAEYLALLGVSHLYASPYLQAVPGSTHGYDIVDYSRVSEELGGVLSYERMCLTLRQHNLGQILDIVPNHMAIGVPENLWWWDVLEKGPASPYACFFDVYWDCNTQKILLPVLGDHFEKILESKQLQINKQDHNDFFLLHYGEMSFPIALHLQKQLSQIALQEVNDDLSKLKALLEQQHYQLVFWKHAKDRCSYRRFFDINHLAALKMEDINVFSKTHQLILKLLQEGIIDGVRVDHIDGLKDPEQYLHRLRQQAPKSWIIVEKILLENEELPPTWPVDGTTGYDFMNLLLNLFINPSAKTNLTDFYLEFTDNKQTYPDLLYQKKCNIMEDILGGDLHHLTGLLLTICNHRFTPLDLRKALVELIAQFPVYRTYIRAEKNIIEARDAQLVKSVVAKAIGNNNANPELLTFFQTLLLLEQKGPLESDFVMRFQQVTGPVMAKSAEDTAFYCYHRFSALNEVGGEPDHFGQSIDEFHQRLLELKKSHPYTMVSTSTHDTKRSEDVRMRLAVLSEVSLPWSKAVRRWSLHNQKYKNQGFPDNNSEYLLYNTLFGAWPIDEERLSSSMIKSSRESKLYTSWLQPDPHYEAALLNFIHNILQDEPFMLEFVQFVRQYLYAGRVNSLAQTLIKLTAMGVPDIYQGCELWYLSLVDPDNRRKVDYQVRRQLLEKALSYTPEQILQQQHMEEGMPKIWLIHKMLHFRKQYPHILAPIADYVPLKASGEKKEHVLSFMRSTEAITVIPRLTLALGHHNPWKNTTLPLPPGIWNNLFTGESLKGEDITISKLLNHFPVAFLYRSE
ncbi:MAG: malto-oligosyltrehalose synthase [Oligoflexia bacterium]|nr:malto-oligosyltrehalose synthase [Oligoflexia bacterium]